MKKLVLLAFICNAMWGLTWKDVGVEKYAHGWYGIEKYGLTPEIYKSWKAIGADSLQEVTMCLSSDIDLNYAKPFAYAGFSLYQIRKDAKRLQLTPEDLQDVHELKNMGFSTLTDISNLKEDNLINDIGMLKKWHSMGVDSFWTLSAYKKKGILKDTDIILRWYKAGFLVDKYGDMYNSDRLKEIINYIKEYEKKGFTVSQIKEIKKLGYKNASINNMMYIVELNIKPSNLLKSLFTDSLYSPHRFLNTFSKKEFQSFYNALEENGCKTLNTEGAFSDSDAYDNEGSCYLFAAKLFQRLDRNNGLAAGGNNGSGNVIFVNFNTSWREGTAQVGIIKGLGSYSYETTYGSRKVTPKGKVIWFKENN